MKAGIVSELNIDNSELRYDITTETHGHLNVINVARFTILIRKIQLKVRFERIQNQFYKYFDQLGICKDCLEKKMNSEFYKIEPRGHLYIKLLFISKTELKMNEEVKRGILPFYQMYYCLKRKWNFLL